jgi:hypothetical protein
MLDILKMYGRVLGEVSSMAEESADPSSSAVYEVAAGIGRLLAHFPGPMMDVCHEWLPWLFRRVLDTKLKDA